MPLFTSEYVFSDDYPTIEPSLKLDFANARALDPRITFTRASTATYVGRDGLIKTAGEDEARFDHDPATGESLGLLIEEGRTNYAPLSEDYSTSTSTIEATITINTQISPDGTQTADTITANSVQSTQHGSNKQSTSLPANSSIALSVFVKSGTSNYARIDTSNITNWSSNAGLSVDLSNGNIISGSGTVVKYPNGWWRITTIGVSNSSTNVSRGMWVWVSNASGASVTNLTGTESIHVWGAQIEAGSFPTSYIPTSGSTATRALEYGYTTNMDFYNQNEGSIFSEVSLLDVGNTSGKAIWSFNVVGGFGEGIYMVNENGGTGINHVLYDNSVSQYSRAVVGSISANQFYKTIYSQQTNNVNSAGDGSVGTDDTSATLPTIGRLVIGNNAWGSSPLTNGLNPSNCHMKSFSYYPKRLTNAQLQTLTQ